MSFHPKRDRSKSIPIINVNLRLKALKELKEDIQMKKNKVPREIENAEEELIVPVLEYSYNHIDREIMDHPIEKEIIPTKP
jgi:L-lysine 2,3-aminomutase